MDCRYCNAWNDDDEHRCNRCGRRLKPSTARPALSTFPISTATAPALVGLYESVSKDAGVSPATEPQADPAAARRVAYQRALFHEMQRVVSIPTIASPEPARRATAPRAPRIRRPAEGQGNLDFNAATLGTHVEAVIYCDAPVALPTHRLIATALDLSLVLMALGLFMLTFELAGGDIVLNRETTPVFAGIAVVLALFYHFLFCLAGGDTAGMQWTQLRLVDFDGRTPDREQRIHRLAGTCLSLLAAGMGLIWALVDEESLTWHDHISKTFPSPRT